MVANKVDVDHEDRSCLAHPTGRNNVLIGVPKEIRNHEYRIGLTTVSVVHYCVTNMPGAVARTSTFALNNATIGHALALAEKGWKQAIKDDFHLQNGLNVGLGNVTYEALARALGYDYVAADTFF